MINMKKWTKKSAAKCDDKDVIFVRLMEDSDGDIGLIVCDKNGDLTQGGALLYLRNGFLVLPSGINENIPVKTDICGQLIPNKCIEISSNNMNVRKRNLKDMENLVKRILQE